MKKWLVFALIALVGCSSDSPDGKTEAEILYKEAQELVDSERYILATEKLNLIKSQHPYSFYATPAELLLADVQFKQESYVEAAASFLLFRDFHPKHEKIPYVVFMIGESYYNQLPSTIDRDLEAGLEAIKYYTELLDKYPSSEWESKARSHTNKTRRMLREKDQYIADFYFKTEVWQAARFWYLEILKSYQEKTLRSHAALRVVSSSLRMKKYKECMEYGEKFAQEVEKSAQSELKSVLQQCQSKS